VVQGIAARGAQVKRLAARCAWARAADALGNGGLIRGLSSEVANGSASLRDTAEDASDVLLTVVSTLSHAHDPSGRQALMAIQADSHPLHDRALASMLAVLHDASSPWFSDSFCLGMLASKLDDTTLTENWCSLAGRQVNLTGRTMGMENLPDGINPADCMPSTQVRRCDAVATLIAKLLMGVPIYHPLLKDRDLRRARMRSFIAEYGSHLRSLAVPEVRALALDRFNANFAYLPSPPHAATIGDVAARRAIFALGPGARSWTLQLPAVATYLIPGKVMKDTAPQSEKVLVVQAEQDAGGAFHYGIVCREGALEVDGSQLAGIQTIDEKPTP
jgi:hypothetical protein